MKTWKILLISLSIPAVAIVVIGYFAFFYTAHLDEKRIHGENATAIWYNTSEITFGNEWVDLEKDGRSENVLRADFIGHSFGIDSIYFDKDTVIIRASPHFHLYDFKPYQMGYHIRVDTTSLPDRVHW
jgi:hypothetical protein